MNLGETAMLSRRHSQRLRRLLRNSPRSELWYPHELQTQILLPNDDQVVDLDSPVTKVVCLSEAFFRSSGARLSRPYRM